jgi:predicted tellurium resistance membrane protein TerC
VRRPPPNLAAPAGVRVDEAPKERPPGFAGVVIETRDLFFAVESVPGVAVAAVTNVPQLDAYAATICGVRVADDNAPHLLVRSIDGTVAVPTVHSAGTLLEAFLMFAADVFVARAAFNPAPIA